MEKEGERERKGMHLRKRVEKERSACLRLLPEWRKKEEREEGEA